MSLNRDWRRFPDTYREKEVSIISNWIRHSTSGTVVGLSGSGKSNLLGFMCHRPDVIRYYVNDKPTELIPIDLNGMPDEELVNFYRLILRSFYELRQRFKKPLQEHIQMIYQGHKKEQDLFLLQSGLREILFKFREQKTRIVLILDKFDTFCENATPHMTSLLRSLRDSFKDTLIYIMGMDQEAIYLSNPEVLGEVYEILDTAICWVGPMSKSDARNLIYRHTAQVSELPTEQEIQILSRLTGHYPSLLKLACLIWRDAPQRPISLEWGRGLHHRASVHRRLQNIWLGLTQAEQLMLSEIQKFQQALDALSSKKTKSENPYPLDKPTPKQKEVLENLTRKGLCHYHGQRWTIFSDWFTEYIAQIQGRGLGQIWFDEVTSSIYQGSSKVDDLTPLEEFVLKFFISTPWKRHTKTDIIFHAWPKVLKEQGVTDDSLYQVISGLRKKIEPVSTRPAYIINWRGQPEGGYQFFPEGRPER